MNGDGLNRPETAPEGGDLTPRQELIAAALASGCTRAEASRDHGVGETTIKRWNKNPAFVRRVDQLRAEMTAMAMGKLSSNMASAAETLGYLSRKAKSETVRLGAARAVLELGVKLKESIELDQRLAALEARL